MGRLKPNQNQRKRAEHAHRHAPLSGEGYGGGPKQISQRSFYSSRGFLGQRCSRLAVVRDRLQSE